MPMQELSEQAPAASEDTDTRSFREKLLDSLRESNQTGADQAQPLPQRIIPDNILVREKSGQTFSISNNGEHSTDDNLGAFLSQRGKLVNDLDLSGSTITDDGLAHLSKSPNLSTLSLENTSITDAGLEALQKSRPTKLTEINLHSTSIGDEGGKALGKIHSLQKLNLNDTYVSSDFASELQGLRNLQVLSLDYSAMGDAGVAELQKLQGLRSLSLKGCPITDDCIKDLVRYPNLMLLNLEDTKLSPEKVARMQQLMPRCVIIAPDGQGAPQQRMQLPLFGPARRQHRR